MVLLPRSIPSDEMAYSMLSDPFPMREGHAGDAVLDLQERLWSLDFTTGDDELGTYGVGTSHAVGRFQRARGLRGDGRCDRETWNALVEAGWKLGERLLYRRTPMVRGDDVAELQRQLSAVGFYTAAIDGIFDDNTGAAVRDFQRNVGLPVDGICGTHTIEELRRLRTHITEGHLVSALRERLMRGTLLALRGTTVAVGEIGGFAQGVAAACRALNNAGAVTLDLHHPDGSILAAEANAADAAVYIGLQLDPTSTACRTEYYSGYRYESVASRRLAELIQGDLARTLGLEDGGVRGMAVPVLRETKMPAVLIELGDPATVVRRTTDVGDVLVRALTDWLTVTWD
jgi:N-acetylmuramoyl-L-alanine amidase